MLGLIFTLGLALVANAISVQPQHSVREYDFKPETATEYWKPEIPILFNFSSSQFSNKLGGKSATSSYYTTSFLTDTDRNQHVILSHILITADNTTSFSASSLNLTDLSYTSFMVNSNETGLQAGSLLNVTTDGNGFESLTEDNVSQMRTYSNDDKLAFDITYNATTMALVDAGAGLFTFGDGVSYEWGLPGCYTAGTLTVGGQVVTIDPENSFTWYDRQWNDGLPSNGNWTWFELHIPATGYKMSIWAINDEEPQQRYCFATIRTGDGSQNVVPITFNADYTRHWYSNASDYSYPLDWTLTIGDYGNFKISSITNDQEIVGPTFSTSGYEGFITFDGTFEGKEVEGFGVVEVFHAVQ
ncbi:hypothetical protein N7466_009764 [Penicillium verhagenii]|uniref:uncharacterized protein n=1 Tax=Penicillium verhagenii TaxID=1562060 RepID=UPI002544E4D8|nr:uncharacterized protein N7466_009764 [Penicillium verhagenii]KAJ5921438.1 hypothetical protein N7466_009764 [Penicillium verhagenii]